MPTQTEPEPSALPAGAPGASGAPGAPHTRDAMDRLLAGLLTVIRMGPAVVLVLMIAVFAIVNPLFVTPGNLIDLVVQTAPILLIGLGQLLVIITQGIDLSVGSIVGFASIAGWMLWQQLELGGWLGLLVMIAIGGGWGLVNALLIVKVKITNPFIVTLGSMYAVGGLSLLLSKGAPRSGQGDVIMFLGSGSLPLFGLQLPMPIIVVAVVAALIAVLLAFTKWGRWIYAVGGNPEGALRAGIPVDAVKISVFVLSGVLAGVAAVVLSGRIAGADANLGKGMELLTIAAVIIGGGSFFGGRGTVWNVIVGALIVVGIRNGLNLSALDSNWLTVVIGAVLVLAVGLDGGRAYIESAVRRRRARRAEGL